MRLKTYILRGHPAQSHLIHEDLPRAPHELAHISGINVGVIFEVFGLDSYTDIASRHRNHLSLFCFFVVKIFSQVIGIWQSQDLGRGMLEEPKDLLERK